MDKIEFKYGKVVSCFTDSPGEYQAILIYINDVSLMELIDMHDFKYTPNNRSLVSEVGPRDLYNNLKYNRIHDHYGDDMKVVLTCSCGSDGCGAVRVRVEEKGDTIVWKDMCYDGRTYKIDKFVFDKEQYNKQLVILKTFT